MYLGNFDASKAGHDKYYFDVRECTLDFRGDLRIHPGSHWGWQTMVLTASHNPPVNGLIGPMILKSVVVEEWAWITSRCLLYNCHIGKGAILSVGAVVRSQKIEPFTCVAGNPAMVIARFDLDSKMWIKVKPEWPECYPDAEQPPYECF